MNGSVLPQQSSGLSFTQGFLLGQLSIALLIAFFIKFFIFGEAPSDIHERRQRRRRNRPSFSRSARPDITGENYATVNTRLSAVIRPSPALTTAAILAKTYYNVNGHQPESVDWFNVLFAQTIAQLRSDAQQDNAILTSLSTVLNSAKRPEFLDEIKVTEINLGEEFPIFSNCRVIPVEDPKDGSTGGRLQARMDVDLSDAITLGIETKLVLNYPRPLVAVMPVALAVSVVRFSGTLSISFIPSPTPPAYPDTTSPNTARRGQGQGQGASAAMDDQAPVDPTPPTTLTFSFLPDYRLELSTHSLLGSRSRLQDVPKIAQLVEARLHDWFDERCVEPRFQQIVLPSLWPRKKNTRGGDADADVVTQEAGEGAGHGGGKAKGRGEGYEEEELEVDVRSIPGSFDSVQEEPDVLSRAPSHSHSHDSRARPPASRPAATISNTSSARPAQHQQHPQPTRPSQLRHRYSNTYEGEVNSSPPRPNYDDSHHDHAPSDFVSGRDLEQRLLQQRQRQKVGGRGSGNGGVRPSGIRP